MAKEEFSFDSLQDCETIKSFLESLVDGFEKGRIILSTNGDEIMLMPKGLLNFSVKAKRKSDGSKMSIKIAWKEAPSETALFNKSLTVGS